MANPTLSDRLPHVNSRSARLWLQRATVVALVLLLSAVMGFQSSTDAFIYILAGVAGLVFSFVVLKQPGLGLIALVLANFFLGRLPISGVGGFTFSAVIVGVMLALWLFDMIARERRIEVEVNRLNFSLIAFAIIAILAFISGQLPWFPIDSADLDAQIGGLGIMLLAVAIMLTTGHQLDDSIWLQRLVWVFVVAGTVYIVGFLFPGLGRFLNDVYFNGGRGSMFWNWMAAMAFAQFFINTNLELWKRALLGALVLVLFYLAVGLNRGWVSGWLPAITAVVAIVWLRMKRLRLFIVIGAVVAALVFTQTTLWAELVGENQYSLLTRGASLTILLEIVKVNPLLGLGPANYYWYTPLFPILGWYVQFNSHNQYVDLIAQTGILGMIALLWFAVEYLVTGWRLLGKLTDSFELAYIYGVLGGFIGMIVSGFLGDWFLPFVYNIGVTGFNSALYGWMFMGGLIVIGRRVKRRALADS
jgi:O-antigen ligase